ncbi:MAG: hypothetical protein QOD95_2503, partial [Gammaproteobacteria bacterium]|nr:hypothetical protein [Gammaproteobacteria bacterium]
CHGQWIAESGKRCSGIAPGKTFLRKLESLSGRRPALASTLGFGKNFFLPITVYFLADEPLIVEMLQLAQLCFL